MEKKGRFKVQYLQKLEKDVQQKWDENKVFELDAPKVDEPIENKFFVTFPFPYMNGRLHLGHSFSLSKCEFAIRYNRLKGKRCLFPFGLHCTGMPIKACADKLKRELEEYGYPPQFPVDIPSQKVSHSEEDEITKDKSKGKKSKAASKSVGAKYQWQIMRSLGLSDEEIKKFCDTDYWLDYFPPLAVKDLKSFGVHVDWRRTFITTDVNPFFSSFVQWQFIRLRESQKVKYGKRYTIFCERDGQPCMDHDRASGEGVGPQEYTLILLKLIEPYPSKLSEHKGKPVYLVAATLRPETMYGQTNCWVQPNISYICFESTLGLFICTKRAARNMAFQGLTAEDGKIGRYIELMGEDIVGKPITAPLSEYKMIYSLPMLTIKADKGTGIVTSVPSDSPDDYAALLELKKSAALRTKYHIEDYMVMPYDPIPIIYVPDLGNLSAVTAYRRFGVKSVNDKEKLLQSKELVYLKGFYDGIMTIGEYKGNKVQEVKKLVKNKLIEMSLAAVYYEPEKQIISRSGDECVVALCDQWFLDYGEPVWKALAEKSLDNIETYHEEVRRNFKATLNWLHEHACARTYGLGTKLPWDDNWLIESLSDSTIYMAYYTIAHYLQGGTFRGENGNQHNIKPEDMTLEVWDYIFNLRPFPKNTNLHKTLLDEMRKEFMYWYPVDLRCSGKDLIQNHLTYFIYVHTAIWSEDVKMWPQGIRANGHLLLNSEKMSKSEGNFLTLEDAVNKFSADGTRLALADAGDSIEDANFVEAVADAGVLRLYTFIEWVKEMITSKHLLRSGPKDTFHDRVFISEMNQKITETDEFYKKMLFKEALRTGFFEMQSARDKYRDMTSSILMHEELVMRFICVQALLIAPICPHVAEHIFSLIGENASVLDSKWPVAGEVDKYLIKSSAYLMDTAHTFRIQVKNLSQNTGKGKDSKMKLRDGPFKATIYIAKCYPPWQAIVLQKLKEMYELSGNNFPENKLIAAELVNMVELSKYVKRVMPFVQYIKDKVASTGISALNLTSEIDEMAVLSENKSYLLQTLNVEEVKLLYTDDPSASENIKQETSPCSPYLKLELASPGLLIKLINPQPNCPHFNKDVVLRDGVSVSDLKNFLNLKNRSTVTFWRWEDPILGSRMVPVFNDITAGKIKMDNNSLFRVNIVKKLLQIEENGNFHDIGDSISYIVDL
uniref:leucine--tRNA ligase n=1 Tax=Triatoma dimidiata TaxID=72491 RepID=A0A0V0G4H9_TRIDM